MSSSVKPRRSAGLALFEKWNRKVHYYLGLYFLFFLWLFSLTGLLLNHSWKFAEFWPNRRISISDRPIRPPAQADDLHETKDLMRQLGLDGEVEWTAARNDPGHLN